MCRIFQNVNIGLSPSDEIMDSFEFPFWQFLKWECAIFLIRKKKSCYFSKTFDNWRFYSGADLMFHICATPMAATEMFCVGWFKAPDSSPWTSALSVVMRKPDFLHLRVTTSYAIERLSGTEAWSLDELEEIPLVRPLTYCWEWG